MTVWPERKHTYMKIDIFRAALRTGPHSRTKTRLFGFCRSENSDLASETQLDPFYNPSKSNQVHLPALCKHKLIILNYCTCMRKQVHCQSWRSLGSTRDLEPAVVWLHRGTTGRQSRPTNHQVGRVTGRRDITLPAAHLSLSWKPFRLYRSLHWLIKSWMTRVGRIMSVKLKLLKLLNACFLATLVATLVANKDATIVAKNMHLHLFT